MAVDKGAAGADAGADKGAAAGAGGAGDKGAAGAAADAGKSGTILDAGAADKGGDKGAGAGADKGAAAGADDKAGDKGVTDWRDRIAGEDTKYRRRLDRFADEASYIKSLRSLEARMSSGEFKRELPEGATDEEKATWRKEQGLPEKPELYVEKLDLPKGMVIGEADKPIVGEFAKAAFEANIAPKQFSALVAQHYKNIDAAKAAQEDADAAFKQASDDDLRSTWQGAEYRQNLGAIQNMMATWPDGLATRVLAGRTPDGRKLGDDPHFVRQMAALARELNPAATLLPAGSGANAGADRLAEIRKFRVENPDKYDADKKMQAEELALIDADLKMKNRGSKAA